MTALAMEEEELRIIARERAEECVKLRADNERLRGLVCDAWHEGTNCSKYDGNQWKDSDAFAALEETSKERDT